MPVYLEREYPKIRLSARREILGFGPEGSHKILDPASAREKFEGEISHEIALKRVPEPVSGACATSEIQEDLPSEAGSQLII